MEKPTTCSKSMEKAPTSLLHLKSDKESKSHESDKKHKTMSVNMSKSVTEGETPVLVEDSTVAEKSGHAKTQKEPSSPLDSDSINNEKNMISKETPALEEPKEAEKKSNEIIEAETKKESTPIAKNEEHKEQKKLAVKRILVNSVSVDVWDLNECMDRFGERAAKANEPKTDYPTDLIVILDLDLCLVKSLWSWEKLSMDKSVKGPLTLLRPGLAEFLRSTLTRYKTYVFTAGNHEYANAVSGALEELAGVSFAGIFWNDHVSCLGTNRCTKDLASLGIRGGDLSKIVHVDDDELKFYRNPNNGIPIRDFRGQGNDTSLKSVTKLLRELEGVKDVRPVLEKRFGIEATFKKFPNFGEAWCNESIYDELAGKKL